MLKVIALRLAAALPNLLGVVVITFLLLFFVNFVITTLYLELVPGKGA